MTVITIILPLVFHKNKFIFGICPFRKDLRFIERKKCKFLLFLNNFESVNKWDYHPRAILEISLLT
jgi:hypothetical protein